MKGSRERGRVEFFRYDALGHLTSRLEPGDDQPSTWTLDTATKSIGQSSAASAEAQANSAALAADEYEGEAAL